jgi:hypothetical protein
MEYHANVAVSRFVSGASVEIVACGVVTNRLASVRQQSSMALREADDIETELGPFGPVNITMKVALEQFFFQCVCVVPILVDCCYVLGYSTQKTISKPFSRANNAKLDSLLCVLCAVCVYCVSCVQALYISSRMDRNTISSSTGLPYGGSGGSSWGLVMYILRLPQKSTARFCARARSKRRGG